MVSWYDLSNGELNITRSQKEMCGMKGHIDSSKLIKWATIGPPAKRHSNGVSLMGR